MAFVLFTIILVIYLNLRKTTRLESTLYSVSKPKKETGFDSKFLKIENLYNETGFCAW